MIYRSHVIHKNGLRLQEDFPSEIEKKEFIALLWVSYCWYLNVL